MGVFLLFIYSFLKFQIHHGIFQIVITFLDSLVHLTAEGDIWTKVYCKPTDNHSYLCTLQVSSSISYGKEPTIQPGSEDSQNMHICH